MKKILAVVLVLAMLLSMCACGEAKVEPTEAPTATPAPVVESHYPVTITNYDESGNLVEQTYEKAPERIVCVQPQTAQLLLSMGLGDKIVGATRSVGDVNEKYIDEFNKLNILVDRSTPSEELVLAEDPDIIIGWGSAFSANNLNGTQKFVDRGINTYILENTVSGTGPWTVEKIYNNILNLGKIFDIEDRANEMVADMKARLATLEKVIGEIPEDKRVDVLTVQVLYENEYYGRSDKDLIADMVKKAGAISLDGAAGKQSMELLIGADPDVLLFIDRTDQPAAEKIETLNATSSVADVPAIVNQHFASIDYIEFYGGTYECIDIIEDLAEAFYPEEIKAAKDESHYPVTVKTYGATGGQVIEQTFDKAPERVLSVSQANTELLLSLGLGDKIVGTAHRSNDLYPSTAEEYESLNFVCDNWTAYPSKEVALSLDPDLIIGCGSLFAEKDLGPVENWHDLGISTYLMKNTVSGIGSDRQVSWILDDIEALGQIFNIEDRTDALIEQITNDLDKIKENSKNIPMEERPTVFTVQMINDNEIFTRASTDLTADIIELAGGNCLDTDYGYHSVETLLGADPDVIMIINRTDKHEAADSIAKLKANESLKNMKAIKNDNFFIIDHVSFYCGGVKTLEDIFKLADYFEEIK